MPEIVYCSREHIQGQNRAVFLTSIPITKLSRSWGTSRQGPVFYLLNVRGPISDCLDHAGPLTGIAPGRIISEDGTIVSSQKSTYYRMLTGKNRSFSHQKAKRNPAASRQI